MEQECLYECSGCHRNLARRAFHEFNREGVYRPVTSRCRVCRREDIMTKKFPDTICSCCNNHRALNANNICNKCNAEAGIRECQICHLVLPMFLSFVQRQRTCKNCRKNTTSLSLETKIK